jgi:transcriptional regulator with XRE-family HTH domain
VGGIPGALPGNALTGEHGANTASGVFVVIVLCQLASRYYSLPPGLHRRVNGDDRVNEDATARRRQLGRLLRRARDAAGLTQTAVARRLNCGQAKVNKMETKLVRIDLPELETLLDLYDPPPELAAELRKLAALDQQESLARTKHSMTAFSELGELEPEASEIWCWHSERIPGPLQSELYILKQHESLVANDQSAVTRILRERTARTRLFTVPNPPRYRVVLSESSFHRLPGGRTTQMVVDQSEHLIRLTETYRQLELRILTFEANLPYVDSDFQLLLFNDTKHDFVYIEYPGGSRKYRNANEVNECREHWAALNAAALAPAASREFLEELVCSARRDSYDGADLRISGEGPHRA